MNNYLADIKKFGLLNQLKDTFKLLNIKNSYKDFNNAISSKISIEDLFKINNINYNLQYIIISMPKTGNNFIEQTIKENITNDVIFFHSLIEWLYKDLRFINYTVKDILLFISSATSYKKLFIILSYREPTLRYISRYFWNLKIGLITNNILDNVKIINNDIYEKIKNDDFIYFKDCIKDFNLNLSNYNYNLLEGYKLININNNLSIVFTKLNDLDRFNKNFLKLNINNELIFKNKNELYKKNIIKFEDSIKKMIYDEEYEYVKFYKYI